MPSISPPGSLPDADRIRVAIALAALKFKPDDQSYTSYVLDLHSKFPPSKPAAPSAGGSWRTHALNLERDFSELKAKYEAEQIKTMTLAANASLAKSFGSTSVPNSSSEQLSDAASKKKSKKKSRPGTETRHVDGSLKLDMKALLERLHDHDIPAWTPGSRGSLLSAMDTFAQLTALPKTTSIHHSLVFSITFRAVEAISVCLEELLQSHKSCAFARTELLQTLSIFLYQILTSTCPLLHVSGSSEAATNRQYIEMLLVHLLEHIFLPVIRSFLPLSHTFIHSLLLPNISINRSPPRKPSSDSGNNVEASSPLGTTDIRTEALSLFRTVFYCIFPPPSASYSMPQTPGPNMPFMSSDLNDKMSEKFDSLRAALILETVREVSDVVLGDVGKNSNSNGSADDVPADNHGQSASGIGAAQASVPDKRRVMRLGAKDTIWYLCTILHFICPEGTASRSSRSTTSTPVHCTGLDHAHKARTQVGFEERFRGEEAAIQLLEKAVLDSLFKLVIKVKSVKFSQFRSTQQTWASGGILSQSGMTPGTNQGEAPGSEAEASSSEEAARSRVQGRRPVTSQSDFGISESGAHEHCSLPLNGGNDLSPGGLQEASDAMQGHATGAMRRDETQGSTPSSDTKSLDKDASRKQPDEYLIDEVGYEMLLSVVERYVMGLEGSSSVYGDV
ncbi:hypothetical protein BDQ12DRAFT_95372 [Crucibulum laeve]|uniref:Uncharacterized protein n=1 Tax=Crucibulum laeve TaxID=68775 RepID=A0A5C3LZG7_9AGAR|nr:hypothetical protein BDQ12DRAFT_95372 [Crucibulum laeve]